MKYSFVLPAYKARFLNQAIESILAQTYSGFELIIVNDASPEDLDTIVESYFDSRIKYYKNRENVGGKDLVKQWNYCLSLCESDYIILASDDDIYAPNYLVEMDKLIQKYPDSNVFRPRIKYIDEFNNIIGLGGFPKEFISDLEFLYAWTKGWIDTGIPFYVFKRTALNTIGGFAQYPLAWFSDDATVLRLSNNGIVTSSNILFSFRLSGQSITTRLNSKSDILSKLRATDMFYNESMLYINKHVQNDGYSDYLRKSLQNDIPGFLQNDKVRGQLFHATFKTVTSLLPKAMQLPFVSGKKLILYYFIYLLKRVIS